MKMIKSILRFLNIRIPIWCSLVLITLTIALLQHCTKPKHPIITDLVSEKQDTINLLAQLEEFPQLTKTTTVVDTIYKVLYKTSYREVVDTVTEVVQVIVPDTVKIIEDWTTERLYSTSLQNFRVQSKVKYNRLTDVSIKEYNKFFPYVGVGIVNIPSSYYTSIHLGIGYSNLRLGSQVLYSSVDNSFGLGLNFIYEFK